MMKLKALRYLVGICLSLCVIVGCDPNKADLPAAAIPNTQVAFYDLIPDMSAINMYVNGTRQNSSKVDYSIYSGYFNIPSGDQMIGFKTDDQHAQIYLSSLKLDLLPSSLFVTGKGGNIAVIQVKDTAATDTKNIKPKVRFVHASADAPALDLVINSASVTNQAYKSVSPYFRADTGKVNVTVKATGAGTVIYSKQLTLVPSGIYTMYIYGSLAGGNNSITLGTHIN